jgi:predicted acetyltransferase
VDIEIRTLTEGDYPRFFRSTATGFGEKLSDDIADRERRIMEPDRTLAAFDGDQIVAGVAAVPFQLTVPGGTAVPCGGVTSVTTLPTHRRRGLSTQLMHRLLEDVHEREEPLSYLWASEAAIYQRFGYGTGALACAFHIDRHRSTFLVDRDVPGRMRIVEKDDALKLFPDVYERVRPERAGMTNRTPEWWWYGLHHAEGHAGKDTPLFFAVYETGQGVEGYVWYSIQEKWSHRGGPAHILEVEELLAATDEAYSALWRYCFQVDLVTEMRGWKRPIDEPLLSLLIEPRALGFSIRDGSWLRIVDVVPALEGRSYAAEGRVVIRIRDGFADWCDGTYELEAGPGGATCRKTDADPDLSFDMNVLSSAYLGGATFRTLHRAGRIDEHNAGAVERADAMFATAVAPWCPWIF